MILDLVSSGWAKGAQFFPETSRREGGGDTPCSLYGACVRCTPASVLRDRQDKLAQLREEHAESSVNNPGEPAMVPDFMGYSPTVFG